MAEYAGYVASTPVNYGEITKDLVNNFITIDQAKREEDRKTQEELDKNLSNNLSKLKQFNLSSSPTFNSKIATLADSAKTVLYDGQKTGGTRAANLITSNLETGINNINQVRDVINKNYDELKTLIGQSKVSDIGMVYADFYADSMDFSNGEFIVMPDGTIPYVKYDKDGKIASQSSFYDPAALKTIQPFVDPPVNYQEDLTKWMKDIGSYTDEKGNVTIVSPLKNPAFPKAKETKITELTSTDRNTARFLTSVGGYVGYKNDAQKEDLLKNKKLPEDKLIKVDLVNGIPQPILSDKQREAAKMLAEQEINQRVSYAKTLDEPKAPNPLAGLETWFTKQQYQATQEEIKLMKPLVSKANIADKIFSSNNTSDWGPLKEAARLRGVKTPTITNTNEGYKILYGIPKGKSKVVEIARFNSPGEIYAYTTGKENIIDALGEYDRAKEYMSELNTAPAKGKYD